MPGDGNSYSMNPAVARRKAKEIKKAKPGTKKRGALKGIHIEPAENGFSVRTSRKKPNAKHDFETEDTNHVFEDVDGVKRHLDDHLGD